MGGVRSFQYMVNKIKLISIPFIGPCEPSRQEQTLCAAVAATSKIPSNGNTKLEFALCWDNPVVHFGSAKTKHYRCHE